MRRLAPVLVVALSWLGACRSSPVRSLDRAPPPRATAPAAAVARSGPERLAAARALALRRIAEGAAPAPVASGDVAADLATALQLEAMDSRGAAREHLEALAAAHPADPCLAVECVRLAVLEGDPAGALTRIATLPRDREVRELVRVWHGLALLAEGELAAAEPLLRMELARGAHADLAALALARAFVALELHGEARAVLAAGRGRHPADPVLALAEAEVLRDLFLRDDAERVLREVLRAEPTCAPAACGLAELAYETGRVEASEAALAALPPSLDPAVAARVSRLRAALARLRAGGSREVDARSLLAVLRGSPDRREQLVALTALTGVDATRAAALAVAFAHGDAALRTAAVARLPHGDPATVRALLSGPLEAEEDPGVFRAMHEALTESLGPRVALPPGGEYEPGARARVVESWRNQ